MCAPSFLSPILTTVFHTRVRIRLVGILEKMMYVSTYNRYIARQRIYEIVSLSGSTGDGYLSGKTVNESREINPRF